MNFFSKLLSFKSKFEIPFETLNNIYISKDAILNNYDLFYDLNPWCKIFPVLKANAYWHWIKEIAKILNARKIDYLVVDSYYEALKIKEVSETPILLIWYTMPINFKAMDFSWISLVLSDINSLKELVKLNKKIKIHLKVDTWMNRQWLYIEQIPNFLKELKKSNKILLEWICSHLSDADNIDNHYSDMQENKFQEVISIIEKQGFNLKYKHLAASAWWAKRYWNNSCNAIRLGISLYWVNPLQTKDPWYKRLKELKLALKFESTVIIKKFLKKWEFVGYNCTFKALKDTNIWIVPVWYYEWISRKLSSNFCYTYKWQKFPIIWRVCMNLTIIDLWKSNIKVFDKIDIISDDSKSCNSIYKMAEKSETIPYESLTKLAESIRRIIV